MSTRTPPPHTVAVVAELPACDLCPPGRARPARYDAKTVIGPWAYLCPACWKTNTPRRLGLGLGQYLETIAEHQAAKAGTVADRHPTQ